MPLDDLTMTTSPGRTVVDQHRLQILGVRPVLDLGSSSGKRFGQRLHLRPGEQDEVRPRAL